MVDDGWGDVVMYDFDVMVVDGWVILDLGWFSFYDWLRFVFESICGFFWGVWWLYVWLNDVDGVFEVLWCERGEEWSGGVWLSKSVFFKLLGVFCCEGVVDFELGRGIKGF